MLISFILSTLPINMYFQYQLLSNNYKMPINLKKLMKQPSHLCTVNRKMFIPSSVFNAQTITSLFFREERSVADSRRICFTEQKAESTEYVKYFLGGRVVCYFGVEFYCGCYKCMLCINVVYISNTYDSLYNIY